MADTPETLKPMTDGDIVPAPATTTFEPLAEGETHTSSFKEASQHFDEAVSEAESSPSPANATNQQSSEATSEAEPSATPTNAAKTLKENASKFGQQATDRARGFAEDGKARAGSALDQVAQMLTDAAGTVDEKVGAQYGKYARDAADRVTALSEGLKAKDVDELVDDTREFVRKSPGLAIGAAAAIGFVVSRLLTAGYDQRNDV